MNYIFVLYVKENATCADDIYTGLEAQGYRSRQEPSTLTLEAILAPHTVENVILGCAAVVLLWSSAAAQSEWVERYLLFAQQLKKWIVPMLLDDTALPTTLVGVSPIAPHGSCKDNIAQVVAVLPAMKNTDALLTLAERAAHEFISERKAAIEQAAEMVQRGEQREAVLAILDYLAHNDLMDGVREKAREALDTNAGKASSAPPLLHPGDSRHIFGVRCKNGHVSYFDKRFVCKVTIQVPRGLVQRAGKKLDEMRLTCDTCGVEVIVRVDCGSYNR